MLCADYHRYAAGKAVVEGHRGSTQRHHEAGEVHQGTPRHVHGYGDARRKPGTRSVSPTIRHFTD